MTATTEDRPYLSEDRQHVHEVDDSQEKWSTIAHSNTESIGEEIAQPGHHNTDGTSPGRTEHGSRCTLPDGEIAGLCTEGGESRRDIANSRAENTRYNFRTDYAGALRKYLETILSEKEERERNARKRDSASPSVLEKYWTGVERENERASEGSDDSDSASLAGADLIPLLQFGHSTKTLGTFQECMIPGARMRREGWKLPPGDVTSFTLKKRIYHEGNFF